MGFKNRKSKREFLGLAIGSLGLMGNWSALGKQSPEPSPAPMKLGFNGSEYSFRWTDGSQYEFVPPAQSDLSTWRDMLTINFHETASTGEKLAEVANRVLSTYQKHGKVVRTNSKPRTASEPAEHLVVAVLGDREFLEAAFARILLVDAVGTVVVYSHRIYGKPAGAGMSEWLDKNGTQVEDALMKWWVPSLASLQ